MRIRIHKIKLLLAFVLLIGLSSTAKTNEKSKNVASKRQGLLQKNVYQAFEIPDYQVDQELLKKMREEMSLLAGLARNTQNVNQRADILFRLADTYWLFDRSVYFKKMESYNQDVERFSKGLIKEAPVAPKFSAARSFAVYKEILKSAPSYVRYDEVLFLAGYHAQELGTPKEAGDYFSRLVSQYPSSRFGADAYMELGGLHFEERKFDQAISDFKNVISKIQTLKNFALYKIAWCYYNKADPRSSMKIMQSVVQTSKGKNNEIELREEALKDLIVFYSDLGLIDEAQRYFVSIGEPKYAREVIAKLAVAYFDQARYDKSIDAYRRLIGYHPLAPDVPAHHSKLIEAYQKSEKLELAMTEMNVFNKNYLSPSAWFQKNQSDKEAVDYAFERAEVFARFLAKKNHELAQKVEKTKPENAKIYTQRSMTFYDQYVNRFASVSSNIDEMRYLYGELLFNNKQHLPAADQFEKVALSKNKVNKNRKEGLIGLMDALGRLEDAHYKTIEDSLKKQGTYTKAKPSDHAQRLIQADALFVSTYPKDPKVPTVLLAQAQIHYNYNDFEKAKAGFFDLIAKHPSHSASFNARHLVLDIFNIQRDWVNLEKHARLYINDKPFISDKAQNQQLMLEFIQGSSFQRAQDLENQNKTLQAAKLYESLVRDYPTSKFADKALYNASLAYLKADESSKAMNTADQFLKQYPKSPLVPKIMLVMATHFDDRLDYENAARHYEYLYKLDPKSQAGQDALYNAALYRENLKQFTLAIENYQTYLKNYPTSKDAPDTLFSQGLVYEKAKNYKMAASTFQDYTRRFTQDKDKVVEANHRRATNLQKSQDPNGSLKAFMATAYLSRKYKKGVPYGARAEFELTKEAFKEFKAIKFPSNPSLMARALNRKTALLKQLKDQYLKIIDTGDAAMGVASLYHLGAIYQDFSLALFSAPLPSGLNPEQISQYQQELQSRATPFETQAIEAFEKTISKAFELQVYDEWTQKAYNELTQYKPNLYPALRGQFVHQWISVEPIAAYRQKAGPIVKPDSNFAKPRNLFELSLKTPAKSPDVLDRLIKRNEDAVTANPRDLNAYIMLGKAYQQLNDLEMAYQNFENALLLNAHNTEVLWELGRISSDRKMGKSISYYGEILKNDPDNWTVDQAISVSLRKSGQLQSALKQIRKTLSVDKSNIYAINNLALLYMESKKLELAELTLQKGLKLNPNHSETLNNLGMVYLGMDMVPNAIKAFEQSYQADNTFYVALINLANIYMKSANHQKAAKALEEAYKNESMDPVLNNNLGLAYLAIGQNAMALETFSRSLQIAPKFAPAMFNLGLLYHQYLRNKDKAVQYYQGFVDASGKEIDRTHEVFSLIAQAKNMKEAPVVKEEMK